MADVTGQPDSDAGLDGFQRECIDLFVHAAQALSLPRSIGEIYGLLYASERPIHLDGVVDALGISKGSASQGLRWLRDLGAVRPESVEGDRREHFIAETELRRLVTGFLEETVKPQLSRGSDYLDRVDAKIERIADPQEWRFASGRAKKLRRWHQFGSQILPAFLRLAEKF